MSLFENKIFVHTDRTSPDLICVCRDGIVASLGERALEIFGEQAEADLLGQPFNSFLHTDNHVASLHDLALKSRSGERVQVLWLRGEHSPLALALRATALNGGSGSQVAVHGTTTMRPPITGAMRRKITSGGPMAQNRATRDLPTDLVRLAEFSASPVFVTRGGNIRFANTEATRVFGGKTNNLHGTPFSHNLASHHQPLFDAGLSRLLDEPMPIPVMMSSGDGRPLDVELTLTRYNDPAVEHDDQPPAPPDGTEPVSSDPFILIQIHDVTAYKRSIRALKRLNLELEDRVNERIRELRADLAERIEAQQRLEVAATVFDATNEGVIVLDSEFKITAINTAFEKITGYSGAEAIGQVPFMLSNTGDGNSFIERIGRPLRENGRWSGEIWCHRKDGLDYAIELSIGAIQDARGEAREFAGIFSDITERKRHQERIQFRANFDTLTGLPNRAYFSEKLRDAMVRAENENGTMALMFIDLDGFKVVNDTMGHDIGDRLLQATSGRLASCLRKGDTVARLGGDEFTILVNRVNSIEQVNHLASRVLKSLSKPFFFGGKNAVISGSVGITFFPADGDTADQLMRNADAAMYCAKGLGKDTYQFYTDDLLAEEFKHVSLKTSLIEGIDGDELILAYQPIVNLETGAVTGLEALLRWQSQEHGALKPEKFLRAVNDDELAVKISDWTIDRACRQLAQWAANGDPLTRIAINLSYDQIKQPEFVSQVKNFLATHKVAPEHLEFEISENVVLEDPEFLLPIFSDLAYIGIRLTIDDFGSGYSSLSHLIRFPFHTLKIEKSFTSEIEMDARSMEVAKAIISLGASLNKDVIAVGVETEEQARTLRLLGCTQAQGYLYSHPIDGADVPALVKTGTRPSASRRR